jgi:CRP/FNR family nitrogen fixation transcriptional regulator
MFHQSVPRNEPAMSCLAQGAIGIGMPPGAVPELTGRLASFARNAAIYREGDPTEDMYKVVSGMIRTYKLLLNGRRQIGAFYLPGDTFGLEPGAEHFFWSEAVVHTDVLVINCKTVGPSQLWDLMRHELQLTQSHVLLLSKSAPERVASFLLEMAERMHSSNQVKLPMSRRDIGDHLGLTIETVCRTLRQLEKQSAIALPAFDRIILRNANSLKELVEGNPWTGREQIECCHAGRGRQLRV